MIPHERSLVKRMSGRPFALIGVNTDVDREKLKRMNEKSGVNWRSFWQGAAGTAGAIPKLWNVHCWPTLYLIDHEGIIREKWVGSGVPDARIEQLVRLAEQAAAARR